MTVHFCGNMRSRCWKLDRRYNCSTRHRLWCTGKNSTGTEQISPGRLDEKTALFCTLPNYDIISETNRNSQIRSNLAKTL